MTNKLFTFAALSSLLVAMPVLAAAQDATTQSNYESGSNGGYTAKDKAEKTDANGTTTTQESTKKVDIDDNGNQTTKIDTKDSVDPKGLFNKQTTETKTKKVDKDGKTEFSQKKTVNGTTVEDVDVKKQAQ